jgi:MscS family membrane protein
VASLIYIFLAFIVARLADWVLGSFLKKWAARTKTTVDDVLLRLVKGPVKVVAFVILLHLGLRVFQWPEWFNKFVSKSLLIVVALSLTYVALRAIDVLASHWKRRTAAAEDKVFDEQLLPIMRNSLKVFVVVVAVLLTSQHLGLNITSLIASLSIGGLAIGLAAQDTLANLFGAVSVFADKPFRVGDRIRVDGVEGDVEAIGMRSTRLRTLDGHLVAIPNKAVGNATITNITRRATIRSVMNIGLTYDTPADKVKRAIALLEEIYRAEPMTKDVVITFNKFADSALNIEVVHIWNSTDGKAQLKGLQAMNLRVKEVFDREGIEFAFPTQTIYVKETSQIAA